MASQFSFGYYLAQVSVSQAAFTIILAFSPGLTFANIEQDYQKKHVTDCGYSYVNEATPQLLNNKNLDIYYLCFEGFAIGYSPTSKTALWSAEHLTRERIEQANTLERVDNFHEESRLPDRVKAYLSDYKKVPYDRGHLAPNADMPTLEAQYDSFSLANIVPQHPKNNRGTWRSIESRTRYMALKYGEIYVVTGVAFTDKKLKKLHNRVLVPSHLYKAIYVPSLQQAGAYYVPNDDSQRIEVISLNELALRTNLDTMPTVPSHIQNNAMSLVTDDIAAPQDNNNDNNNNIEAKPDQVLIVIANLLLAILEWLASLLQK